MELERGDVVRSSDPFKTGNDRQRPWLIVSNRTHPFFGDQYIALAISTKQYDESLELSDDSWEIGGVPETSFVSPWAVHSPRIEDLVKWQGRVSGEFVDQAIDSLLPYLSERRR